MAKSFCVLVVLREHADIVRLLAPTAQLKAVGVDHLYYLILTTGSMNVNFNDVDGEPLVQVHTFATLEAARDWAIADCKLHESLRSFKGTAQ